ncbi:MAG: MOSC domain-containing protein [Pseudomonadota bacterium]
MAKIHGLYIGEITTFDAGGERTAIYKHLVESTAINSLGLRGDSQADPRFHGGPDKAVHQFAVSAYRTIHAAYPALIESAKPGSMGENLSVDDMSDESVFIGDIYKAGSVILQVSEPRRPCWKINRKFNEDKLSLFVESEAITGWYFRVLQAGQVAIGDAMLLEERSQSIWNIAGFTQLVTQHRPAIDALKDLVGCHGLSALWQKKLSDRIKFLSRT